MGDQRFSNSIWLGKTTGYFEVLVDATEATADAKFTAVGATSSTTLDILPQNGDTYYFTSKHFGAGGFGSTDQGTVTFDNSPTTQFGTAVHGSIIPPAQAGRITTNQLQDIPVAGTGSQLRFAYLQSGATSRQTSDYFAVGSTVEVLPTTLDDGSCNDGTIKKQVDCTGAYDTNGDDNLDGTRAWSGMTTVNDYSNNLYRKFKVTGHVTNQFNTEFAKLDAFPAAEAISQPVATTGSVIATLPDYNLKITNNNGTVRSYENIKPIITVNEVQVIVIQNGITDDAASFKLSYKGEMSQDMDAADGDVAQLEAHATDAAKPVSVVTRENGWSIEAPIGTNLGTMQAGGTINVTAREECKFTVASPGTGPKYYFCYDGVCGSTTKALEDPDLALGSIKDDNGVAILSLAGGDAGYGTITDAGIGTHVFTITLPMGKSCDGLEMRAKAADTGASIGAGGTITKTVDKHNNGKVFKITRAFLQIEEAGNAASLGTDPTTDLTFSNGKGHSALRGASTVVISQKSGQDPCAAHVAAATNAVGDFGLPIYRTLATATYGGAATAGTIGAIVDDSTATKCDFTLQRYVITLDSMPTASNAGTSGAISTIAETTLLYKSPVGSCNVAETTKGTFESYECSNRGACDGKSGLCACYEGYSGESCQTQTVLV